MLVETMDGVEVPEEFRASYAALRYHRKRVKDCPECSSRYYDVTPGNRGRSCLPCAIRGLEEAEAAARGLSLEEASRDPGRSRECRFCLSPYVDRSWSNSRVYCFQCLAQYSRDYLQAHARAEYESRKVGPDLEGEILRLHGQGISDHPASRCPGRGGPWARCPP